MPSQSQMCIVWAIGKGWNFPSPARLGLTPRFIDVLTLLVAIFGIFIGILTISAFVRRRAHGEVVTKGWKYWASLACVACVVTGTIVQTAGLIAGNPHAWFSDQRVWAYTLLVTFLLAMFVVQYMGPNGGQHRAAKGATFYWPILTLLLGAKLQSTISHRMNEHHMYSIVALCTSFGFSCVECVLVWFVPDGYADMEQINNTDVRPRATLWSTLTFAWMTPMMTFGYANRLTENDLWELAEGENTRAAAKHSKTHGVSSCYSAVSDEHVQAILFKVGADMFSLMQPQLLRSLISFVQSRGSLANEVALALAMFLVSVVQSLCLHRCFQRLSYTGVKVKAALISTVYVKSLRLSNGARATKSTGGIVNLMAVDAQRLQDCIQFSQHIWSAPLQILLSVAFLYQLMGPSMLAGRALILVMIPIKKISHIRNDKELVTLCRVGNFQALSGFIGAVAPFLVACAAFSAYVLVHASPLTTDIVFPAFALFHLLTTPLTILPAAISSVTEASVAVTRLSAFITADEVQENAVIHSDAVTQAGAESVAIREATFTWDRQQTKPAIEEVNFTARAGELCCIVGRIGRSKSALIHAILGSLHKVKGTVTVHGSVAYVAQDTWLLNATIRDNITFGHGWDPGFYENTVKACALVSDFVQFPNGDRAAVDQHVARHLVDNVLGRHGLLQGRTRIVVTNSEAAMAESDAVVLLQSGRIAERGTGAQTMEAMGDLNDIEGRLGVLNDKLKLDISSDMSSTGKSQVISDLQGLTTMREVAAQEADPSTAHRADFVCRRGLPRRHIDVESEPIIRAERSKQGRVGWKVYADYAKSNGLVFVSLYAVALIGSQAAEIGSNIWLKHWSETNNDVGENPLVAKFIGVYVAFGLGSAVLVFIQSMVLWLACSIKRYYLAAKRELKRLESTSRSPVFDHFQETLGGVATICAYGAQERFIRENERRVDANMKAYIPSITANRWLGVRLEFVGSVVILLAAGFAVTGVAFRSGQSEGMAGLTISYALQITQCLGSLVRATGEVETNIVSVGRVLEFAGLPSEAPDVLKSHRPPSSWPTQEAVKFVNYSTRYRPDLEPVLRNIKLDIRAKEKIGIIGRTGAGKSSSVLSLFRIIKPAFGSIYIDDLNASSVGLLDLRRRLSIIPQDSALFEGTIRDNLDPDKAHDDTELWAALELAQLKEHVAGACGGLDAKVYEGARALLKPSTILVLDEATAAVDVETDMIIQKTLRDNLSGHRTTITVAHRIHTVIDSDRAVVLNNGEIIEADTPAALIEQKGAFYQLAREAGVAE
ncbi:ATP-binding cassette transporter protein [Metarhizium acridum CQMa 102]|uniref:ATP-binding cassette transporter protein n=1 Tax=Metarhizium acridum (strain CQMa 102) TaxID=655827 RepID=E9E6X0_METAQ|nr:ATP-binding cassette transporter protein [Metarhizium acridum CQMa 102]EFY88409.1 ATP-binding cassette transporter protein [Metarhizium acridum CQMa 102]